MTLVGLCEQCVEEQEPGRPATRQILHHGPDGRHLCKEHKEEAFEELLDSRA